MIIMFIIITLLSWLMCCSQLENMLSFHSKRRLGKFIYHVRKVNSYVFEFQEYRLLCLLGYGTVPTVWYCLFCLSNMFELFRQCVYVHFISLFYIFFSLLYICVYIWIIASSSNFSFHFVVSACDFQFVFTPICFVGFMFYLLFVLFFRYTVVVHDFHIR